MALGKYDMPYSYIKFLLDTLFGVDASARMVDILAAVLFAMALVCSGIFNYRDLKLKRSV